MTHTTCSAEIIRSNGQKETISLSFGGGYPTDSMRAQHAQLVKMAAGDLNLIKEIRAAQDFLIYQGLGLGNVALVSVGELVAVQPAPVELKKFDGLAGEVREFCAANYADGYDTVIECYEEEDINKFLAAHNVQTVADFVQAYAPLKGRF